MANNLTWTALKFGKYEGKTLPQVVLIDPDYFFWGFEIGIFRPPQQDAEAEEIAYRARHIKIPKPDPANWRIEYYVTLDGKFAGFSIEEAQYPIMEPFQTQTGAFLDLSFPRSLKGYDKLGNKLMIDKFREYYSGGLMLTKEKCESFFYRGQNFVWGDT